MAQILEEKLNMCEENMKDTVISADKTMFVSDGSSIQSQEINVVIEENQEVEKLMLKTSIAEQERLALVVTEQQNQIDELLVDLQEAQATMESPQNTTEQIKNGSSEIAKLEAKNALLENKIHKQKLDINTMKEEKSRMIDDKKSDQSKIKELTNEKKELLATLEKVKQSVVDLEGTKSKIEADIQGYVQEIHIHMEVNEKLKKDIEECEQLKQQVKQLETPSNPIDDLVYQVVTSNDAQTTTEDLSKDLLLEDEVLNEIQDLKKENLSLKEEKKANAKEVLALKSQIKEYQNRLENVLSVSAQTKKEKIHLIESLDAVKYINLGLLQELNKEEVVVPERKDNSTRKQDHLQEKNGEHVLQNLPKIVDQVVPEEHEKQDLQKTPLRRENEFQEEIRRARKSAENVENNNNVCWYYSRGYCKFENRCKYKHPEVKECSLPRENNKNKNKKEILCKFYKNCWSGLQCEYKHPGTESGTKFVKKWPKRK